MSKAEPASNFTMLISELSDEKRKSAEESIRTLRMLWQQSDCYLRDYERGEQNVFKMYGVLYQMWSGMEEAMEAFIERHRKEEKDATRQHRPS